MKSRKTLSRASNLEIYKELLQRENSINTMLMLKSQMKSDKLIQKAYKRSNQRLKLTIKLIQTSYN